MSDDPKKENPWPAIIDKLTDPLEMAVTKIFSARFLMSVVVTLFACLITYRLCQYFSATNKELVMFVSGQFFIVWSNIVKDYFGRADRELKKP